MTLLLGILLVVAGGCIAAQGKLLSEERDYSASLNAALIEAHHEVLALRNRLREPDPTLNQTH